MSSPVSTSPLQLAPVLSLTVHSYVYQSFVSERITMPFPRNRKPERLLMGFPGSKFLVYTAAAIHFHRWKKEGA